MASSQNFYTGRAPQGVLVRALTGNIFIEKSLAFMNEGDKDGYNCYKHDISNTLRPMSADPASSISNTTQKATFKRDLTIVESIEQFNPADYHHYWKQFQPSGVFQWEGLPTEIQNSLENLFLGSSAEQAEDALTNGNATVGITGLIPQLLSPLLTPLAVGVPATSVQIVNNTAIAFRAHGGGTGEELAEALTVDNIFSKLELLIRRQTKEQRKRPNRKFMVSIGTGDLVAEAQRLKLNYKGVDVTEEGIMRYAGYEILPNPSFPENTILLCSMSGDMKTDAIQLGTSMSQDFNNLTVDRISKFNRLWAMCLTFALDIFLVRPEEVCFYSTETVA